LITSLGYKAHLKWIAAPADLTIVSCPVGSRAYS
jgi:hypothetical protein